MIGAKDQILDRRAKLFAHFQNPDSFADKKFMRIGLGVGKDSLNLFDFRILFADG